MNKKMTFMKNHFGAWWIVYSTVISMETVTIAICGFTISGGKQIKKKFSTIHFK